MKKGIPLLYTSKDECCGCSACYSICPVKAIAMTEDEDGFEYPVITREKCVGCSKCVNVCPIKMRIKH